MNTLEGEAWRSLAAIDGVGNKSLWRIADYLRCREKPASWLLDHPDKIEEALRGIGRGVSALDVRPIGEGEETAGEKVELLHPLHPAFPGRLRERNREQSLPALLYASGNLQLLERPAVAVVGSRNAGRDAVSIAEKLAAELVSHGTTVVSGYAAGIDSAAHIGALRGKGTTVLVLAEGINRFRLKPGFQGLLNRDNALRVSPFSPSAAWAAFQAMARNKLVVALADAVVVIVSGPERDAGGRMSGSFNAGMSALKLGLPLWVAPPWSRSSPSEGNRELIRRGGLSWNPEDGMESIVASIRTSAGRRSPEPRGLF